MTDASANNVAKHATNSGARFSIAWVWLFVLVVWVSVLIRDRQNAPRVAAPPAENLRNVTEKSALERMDELHGGNRAHNQIVIDNELIDAATAGDEQAIRRALAAGADVNAQYVDICLYGYTALMEASGQGHERLVRLLLDRGADVNLDRNGVSALHLAVRGGHEPVIRQLVAAGARYDANRLRHTDQLIRAACRGFKTRPGEGYPLRPGYLDGGDPARSIEDVLAEGADVNAADPHGFTPLMYAANLGLLENVRVLLDRGADARLQANDGSTALSLAERPESSVNREGRREVVEHLRRHLTVE